MDSNTLTMSAEVLDIPCEQVMLLRRRPPESVLRWAEKHLWITEGPVVGAGGAAVRWRRESFPLQQTIMEAVGDLRWQRIVLMTSPQAFGKTQCAATPAILHAIHERRTSALYVAARLQLAVTQWREKFLPAIEADAGMAELIYDNPDYGGDREERVFTNGTRIHFAGAESAGAIAGFTAPVVVCDDIQAYPAALPKFGHPADVAWSRAGAYPARLRTLIGIGTAGTTSDYLWRALSASALYCPFLPCLGCGTYQLLEWDRLRFDADDPTSAKADTWLKCAGPKCEHRITFDDLPMMLAEHLWVSCPPGENWVMEPSEGGVRIDPGEHRTYPETRRQTVTAGFWCNALYWPLGRTWGELAVDWIDRQGNHDRMKDHQQQIRVIPWQDEEEDANLPSAADLGEHRTPGHRWRTMPEVADLITLAADVHDRFVYYIVRAWRRADGTSWLIDAGTLGVHGPHKGETLAGSERRAMLASAIRIALEDLWNLESAGWPIVDEIGKETGRVARVSVALVDGGYRPDAVGQFCHLRNTGLRAPKWLMVLGTSRQRGAAAIWPQQPKRNRRGHVYWEVGVDEAKHVIRELMAIPRGNPGYMHTYTDRDLDAYHRHMVSEHYVTKRRRGREVNVWEQREGGGPNHWWDCEVYGLAAAIACKAQLPTFNNQNPASSAKGLLQPRTAKLHESRAVIRRTY